MACALGVGNKPGDLRVRRRAVDVQIERHLLKGSWRPAEVVLVSHAEGRPHVDVGFFDRDLVEGRKLRQLGQQSKGGTGEEVLKWSRGEVVAAALGRLIGFDLEPADAADHVHVLVDMRNCTLGQNRNLDGIGASGVVCLLHAVKIDARGLVAQGSVLHSGGIWRHHNSPASELRLNGPRARVPIVR
jgi:hypothetical protein